VALHRSAIESFSVDAENLLAAMAEGLDTSDWFRQDEIDELLAGLVAPEPVEDTPPDVSKASEFQKKWSTQSGQIWQLGKHRLAVGDCTDAATVARLMQGEKAGAVVTDSPYGINREGIINDDPEGLHDLFIGCLSAMPIENAVIINFQSPRLFPVWLDAIREKGHKFERLLWMYDENDQTKPWHYWLMCSQAICVSSIGKPVWSECKAHHDTYVIGLSREWRAGGDANEFAHASVKPVGVIADLIPHTSGIVYEPFCGSGTTLIACQSLSRQCRAIELDSGYVAITLQRFQDATGIEPVLIS
jgi:DNA modification methylase